MSPAICFRSTRAACESATSSWSHYGTESYGRSFDLPFELRLALLFVFVCWAINATRPFVLVPGISGYPCEDRLSRKMHISCGQRDTRGRGGPDLGVFGGGAVRAAEG